jgi:hypothetical protein
MLEVLAGLLEVRQLFEGFGELEAEVDCVQVEVEAAGVVLALFEVGDGGFGVLQEEVGLGEELGEEEFGEGGGGGDGAVSLDAA